MNPIWWIILIPIAVYFWLIYEAATAKLVTSVYYKAFDIPKTAECPICHKTNEILHPVHAFYFNEAELNCKCGYKVIGQGMNPLEAVEDLKEKINRDAVREVYGGR